MWRVKCPNQEIFIFAAVCICLYHGQHATLNSGKLYNVIPHAGGSWMGERHNTQQSGAI